jgi:DNA end-binding protein Ku
LPDAKAPAAAVRPFWSGTITFGLVSIPVELYAAVQARRTSMKLVDTEGHPLGRRYWCPKHEKLLDNDELVRGYETDSGKMVVVTDAEFESAAPEKSRDIDLKSFVPLDAIPPFYFERPFFLAPGERAGKAYALLAQTMARTGKAGIGSFVMRGHEYLVAILSDNGILRAEVLRHADELRTPESVGLPKPHKADAAAVRTLMKAIEALQKPGLDTAEMQDVEAAALRRFAQQKAKAGEGVIAMSELEDVDADAGTGGEVIDLMQVLRQSLGARAGGGSGAGAKPAVAKRATGSAAAGAAGSRKTANKPSKKASAPKTRARKSA